MTGKSFTVHFEIPIYFADHHCDGISLQLCMRMQDRNKHTLYKVQSRTLRNRRIDNNFQKTCLLPFLTKSLTGNVRFVGFSVENPILENHQLKII